MKADLTVPEPTWGKPLCLTTAENGYVIHAEAPGIFRSPPAPKLLLLGLLFFGAGGYVAVGSAITSFQKFEFSSILVLLTGGGFGALIITLGIAGLRWGAAAAWGTTEITITKESIDIRWTGHWRRRAQILRDDFVSTMITDQYGLAYELLVEKTGHRLVRVLSGRDVHELRWVKQIIKSQIGGRRGKPPRG
jgi:hypothetical protein